MSAVASLPMSVIVDTRAAETALWVGIRDALRASGVADVPDDLEWKDHADPVWRSPDLMLSQTCGYPLVLGLDRDVRLVATPVYTAPGCRGSDYSSALVVREDDPAEDLGAMRGRICAYNGTDSQSGYNALRLAVARLRSPPPFFSETIETGGHAYSLDAVARGRADIAAIDCVGLAVIRRHQPEAVAGVRILGWTDPAPGLPFITGAARDDRLVGQLRAALEQVLADPAFAWAREDLLLEGIEVRERADYDSIAAMEAEARELGYARLE